MDLRSSIPLGAIRLIEPPHYEVKLRVSVRREDDAVRVLRNRRPGYVLRIEGVILTIDIEGVLIDVLDLRLVSVALAGRIF